MKEKSDRSEKEEKEPSGLKTAGPEGEITAGVYIYQIQFLKHCLQSWRLKTTVCHIRSRKLE